MTDFMKEHFRFLRDFFEVKPRPSVVYRFIDTIEKLKDGREIWTMECGHQVVVTCHRRLRFPCDACKEKINV